jgi:hypothetical protein
MVIACGMIVSSPGHGSFKLKLDRNPGRETVRPVKSIADEYAEGGVCDLPEYYT